jgi:hypothetical protein
VLAERLSEVALVQRAELDQEGTESLAGNPLLEERFG